MSPRAAAPPLALLESVQKRVLWLSAHLVHHANTRPNPDGTKVGGHQASSSSVVSLMTALYFRALRPGDIVATKAHASPVFYAIEYLRGRLTAEQLRSLRTLGGLQAYPSRRKNPEIVDLSTGSMGLGAVSTAFGALAARYVSHHLGGSPMPRRFIAIMGDAELDEGNVWEALLEEAVRELDNLLWIVDFNRQSLDRIVPDARRGQLREWFRGAGWHVIELRWGTRLRARFGRPGGERLRARLEGMGNAEYQSLLRRPRRHDQGMGLYLRRRSHEPQRAAHPGAAIRDARRARHRLRRGVRRVRGGQRRGGANPRGARAVRAAGASARRGARRPRRAGRVLSPAELDAGSLRSDPRPAEPPARRRPRRDALRRRVDHHASRGVDQPEGRLLPARQARLHRGGAAGGAVEGISGGPAHRARHRRAQPVPRAGRLWPHGGAVRHDAPADRHALRSLRHARARRALPRALRGRALHRGRHPVGGEPLPGGRRAPVRDH